MPVCGAFPYRKQIESLQQVANTLIPVHTLAGYYKDPKKHDALAMRVFFAITGWLS
jgi:hypothetical protein